jgi:excinuclease ABC subunit C
MGDTNSVSDGPVDTAGGFVEDGASAETRRTGHAVVRDYLRRLEERPGVYRMLDARGDVLYVGKARNLKKRVAAYAKLTGHSSRISRMIAATAAMMFLTTDSETEALLLE